MSSQEQENLKPDLPSPNIAENLAGKRQAKVLLADTKNPDLEPPCDSGSDQKSNSSDKPSSDLEDKPKLTNSGGGPEVGDDKEPGVKETKAKIETDGKVEDSTLANQGNNSRITQTTFKGATTNIFGFSGDELREYISTSAASLSELSVELRGGPPDVPIFLNSYALDQLDHYRRVLTEQRALCIGCIDSEVSLNLAKSLLEGLSVQQDDDEQDSREIQKRLLSLRSNPEGVSNLTIFSLPERNKDAREHTVVIVDAVGESSPFIRSLSALDVFQLDFVYSRLVQCKLMVICLVDFQPENQNTLKNKMHSWHVPLLQPLLEYHYPGESTELEQTIGKQKVVHSLWGTHEDTYFQVLDYIRRGDFKEILGSREKIILGEKPAELFNGNDPIVDTTIYVATFFPGLNAREFRRVVLAFLGERKKTIIEKKTKLNGEGKIEEYEAREERLYVDLWNESADAVMANCRLGTVLGRESRRVVSFMKDGLALQFAAYLEDYFPFFVSSQINQIQELGLIFDDSTTIAKNATKNVADLLISDPDHGARFLVRTLTGIESNLAATPSTNSSLRPNAKYQRVAQMLRIILSENSAVPALTSAIEELIQTQKHKAALEIVLKLRGASHFDFLYWLKQLLDRGEETIKSTVRIALYSIIANDGTRVFEMLQNLQSWLKKDTDDRPLSPSELFALQLIAVYCRESTSEVADEDYGLETPSLPLLAFSKTETAKAHLSLLMNWLFGARMEKIFEKPTNRCNFIGALVAEWSFILIGPGKKDHDTFPQTESISSLTLDASVKPKAVRTLLIEQVFASASLEQRRYLLDYWLGFRDFLLEVINLLPINDKDRKTLAWKRNLLNELIREFRSHEQKARTSQGVS
jgi:hypothetical protein